MFKRVVSLQTIIIHPEKKEYNLPLGTTSMQGLEMSRESYEARTTKVITDYL